MARASFLLIAIAAGIGAGLLHARAIIVTSGNPDPTESIPASRLLDNLERSLKSEPGNAHLHYVVARLHSLLFGGP